MPEQKIENARRALAVMTAWASEPDGEDLSLSVKAVLDALDQEETEVDGLRSLLFGFVNLSGMLLIQIATDTGVDEADTLKQLALQIAE